MGGIRRDEIELEGEIGRGVFSVVWRGINKSDLKRVAVKRVLLSDMTLPNARVDCLNEIKLLQKLAHPNVIQYWGSWLEGAQLYIVLELAPHGDLAALISTFRSERRMMGEPRIWRYLAQVTAALRHMHANRIIHRDLKPANVFVFERGVVKVGDLGLSRYLSETSFRATTIVGTPYYMSPERLAHTAYTFASDIWSLGCFVYELACLQSPFYGARLNLYTLTQKILRGDYAPIPSKIYSSQLRGVVESCLRGNSQLRPRIEELCLIADRQATLN